MPRFADATNSFKQWSVGGETKTPWNQNSGGQSVATQRLQVGDDHGDSKDTSLLNLVVGLEGAPLSVSDYGIGSNYNVSTVVGDKSIDNSTKFDFGYTVTPYRVGSDSGKIRMQYHEIHLLTTQEFSGGQTSAILVKSVSSGANSVEIPDSGAFAFRLLANINGIRRTGDFTDQSFSGYVDVSGGVVNLNSLSSGSTILNFIIDQNNSTNYLSDVSRFAFVSTGTSTLSVGPTFSMTASGDDLIIKFTIDNQWNLIGSAKLILVENGFYGTNYTLPENIGTIYNSGGFSKILESSIPTTTTTTTTTTTSTTTAAPECIEYTITNNSESTITYSYLDCDGTPIDEQSLEGGGSSTEPICAQVDSIVLSDEKDIVITEGSVCS
jgi:hypothetical protein